MLSTASSRVLLNGQPGKPIQHFRGVQQGDSLSPFLSILAMEILNTLFSKAAIDGVIMHLETAAITFHCNMYTHDAIIFMNPEPQEAIIYISMQGDTPNFWERCGARHQPRQTPVVYLAHSNKVSGLMGSRYGVTIRCTLFVRDFYTSGRK